MQGNINDDDLNGSGDSPSNDGGETRSSSSFVVSDMLPFPYSTDAFNVNNPFLEPISQFESCLDESCMGAIVDKIVQTCPFADPNSSLTRENSGFVIGEPLEETHPLLFEVPFPSSGLSSYSVSSSSSTPTSPISFSTTYWNFGVENNQEHGVADEIGKSEEEEQGVVNRGTGIENKDYKNEWESNTNLVQAHDDKKSNINVNNQSTQSFILQNPTPSFMESLSGSNDFTNAQLKKIMEAGGRLADMALTDPKRVKRILANRESAARSKERKKRRMVELEQKLANLQIYVKAMSEEVDSALNIYAKVKKENNDIKNRLNDMVHESEIKKDVTDALTEEIERLNYIAALQMNGQFNSGI